MNSHCTMIKIFLAVALCGLIHIGWSGTVTVWIDDAHTRQVVVPKVDPDEIADKSSFSIGLGKSFGSLGVSLSYSRETGIEFNEKMEELLEQIRDLCEEFNDGDLSLETYRRRMRDIFAAEEKARTYKYRMLMSYGLMANKKLVEMDEALGYKPKDLSKYKAHIDESLTLFTRSIDELPHRLQATAGEAITKNPANPVRGGRPEIVTTLEQTQEQAKQAVMKSLEAFKRAVDAEPTPPRTTSEKITIFKDYARMQTVEVYKLDCDKIVDDISKSLSVGAKYSGYFLNFDVGPRVTRVLKRSADYTEAAQVLILKYKQLCMEFNAGLECLDGYVDRLHELMEAEEKARQTRDSLYEFLKDEALAQMDNFFAKAGKAETMDGQDSMEALRKEMLGGAKKDINKKKPSVVEEISRAHRISLENAEKAADAKVSSFKTHVSKIQGMALGGEEDDKLEVWEDDTQSRKITVSRLDTDLIAQTTTTRLSLHITWFNFGPEYQWAKKKGLDYDENAQRLIIMYKQLCMDFNAGLVSYAGFHKARKEIEAAIARAAEVRERMQLLVQAMKQEAMDDMDREFDMDAGMNWGE